MKQEKDLQATPFAAILLQWFASNGRDLPWRHTRDPYQIWLSEVILQQTRIDQGRDYWLRFVSRWPTVDKLAQATEDEVLRQWQGLGYYSRARNLHAAARQVVALGAFPTTLDGLRKLKGVGDYTAAAIASFAFGQRAAVVDGNVYRVLSRFFGIDTPINTTEGKHLFAALAAELLPDARCDDYNQALMDFGATQCTPAAPRCDDCPLADACEALASRRVAQLPVKERRLTVKERQLTYLYIRCKGQTAIRQRGPGDIWQGLWEPVNISDDASLKALLSGSRLLVSGMRHQLTHRLLLADFYLLTVDEQPPLPADYVWIDEARIDDYAIPRLVEHLLEALSEAAG